MIVLVEKEDLGEHKSNLLKVLHVEVGGTQESHQEAVLLVVVYTAIGAIVLIKRTIHLTPLIQTLEVWSLISMNQQLESG